MGGFLGIGGSSSKTDRSMELSGFKDLSNVFNYALPQAQSSIASGQQNLGAAGSYYQNLLSGNRNAVNAAVAPEANAARSSADASKRQLATSGTARGGGSAGTNQQVDDQTQAIITNNMFGARSDAAKGATAVGGTQLNAGTNLLGESSNTASNFTSLAQSARGQDYKINQDMVGKVSQFIEQAVAGLFGG